MLAHCQIGPTRFDFFCGDIMVKKVMLYES